MIQAEVIVALCTIITVCGAIFKYAVLIPLSSSIDSLKEAVTQLNKHFKLYDERLRLCELQIVELNQRVRSNAHRIDALEATHHEMGH